MTTGWTGRHYEQAIAERDELKRKVERCEALLGKVKMDTNCIAHNTCYAAMVEDFEKALNETEGGDDN